MKREHVRRLRVDAALEHVEVGAPNRLEALPAEDVEPTARPLAEWVPGIGDPRLERVAAPVRGALDDSVGGEEKGRWRPGQFAFAGTELFPVGDSHGHAVDELVAEMRMDRAAHLTVSRDVDEGGGSSLERVERVVGDAAVIDPQSLDELGAPRRGQTYELDFLALRQ